eukprot:scaffold388_cov114-Cylindrotheca_fusiformis.AAC.20
MMYPGGPAASTSRLDQCAGCNATDVPLLACDDIQGPTGASDPSKRARFCSNCMIGKKVRVFWPVDNSWYVGTVEQYDSNTGEHLLRYQDEDTEWVRIGESNTTAPPIPGATASPNESSMMEPIQPVSPAGPGPHSIDQAGPPQNQMSYRPEQHQTQQATVSPDTKWPGEGGQRMGGPPTTHHQKYPPSYQVSGMHPGMYPSHPPPIGFSPGQAYPGFHQGQHIPGHGPPAGPYGYPPSMMGMPPTMMSPHAGSDGSKIPQASPSPTLAGNKRKNGPKAWTKDEDALLLNIVQSMRMPMKWSVVAQSLPDRTGKQCRERYVNHLNPRLKVSDWTPVEDATIFHLYNTIGSHWAKMSKMIPGRTDNGIKNRFHNLRRQLEREDEHRLRLSTARDFPEEIRLDRVREFPQELRGKAADLWDMKSGLSVLAAQSVLGGNMSRNAGRFGPFRQGEVGDICVRCGFLVPSVHTGNEVCSKTGWCQSCARIPPHVSGNMLRECLNIRRCPDVEKRKIVESWENVFAGEANAENAENVENAENEENAENVENAETESVTKSES